MTDEERLAFEKKHGSTLKFILDSRRCDEHAKDPSLNLKEFEHHVYDLIKKHLEKGQENHPQNTE